MNKKKLNTLYTGIEIINGLTVTYTDKGEYSVFFSIQNPIQQYCADADLYYQSNDFIISLVKLLGEGYALQKQDIFCKKEYVNVDKNNREWLSEKYFDFFKGRTYTDTKTYLIITQEKKKGFFQFDKKKWTDFLQKIEKVKDLFNSYNIRFSVLSEKETKEYIYRYFTVNFKDQTFSLDNFSSRDNQLKIGNKSVRCISLIDIDEVNLPTEIQPYIVNNINGNNMPVDIMSFLCQTPADCIIYNQVIIVPSQRGELSRLAKKKNRHSSLPDPANEYAAKDIEKVQEDIAKNNKTLLYTHYNIIVSSEMKIQQSCSYIENELYKSGITASKNTYNQFELFLTSFPGHSFDLNPNYDRFLTLEDAAACLFYKENIANDDDSALKIYYTNRQGIPIGIDITGKEGKKKLTTNSNFFSLGPSGSGKSFHMNSVVRQLFEQETDIVMVDTGHSYEGLCEYIGGKYITYSEEKPISMNPFKITKNEYNIEKTNFLKSLVFLIWKGANGTVSKTEDAVIDKVLTKYYEFYFTPFSEYSEEERKELKKKYYIEMQKEPWTEIDQTLEREKLLLKISKLEDLYELGEEGERNNAKRIITKILKENGAEEIKDLKEENNLVEKIENRINQKEQILKRIKIADLSFNSFYEFSIQMIPIIIKEENISFELDDFKFILKAFYKGGKWSRTLNENFDSSLFDEKFIVFEIDAIKDDPELFPIVTLIIMDVFIQKMRLKKNRKALIIEEAWKAIASPLMADYIKYLYKTVRKFWGIVGLVTQELDDIIASEIVKDAIINNSEIIMLLDQSKFKERYDEIARLLGITEVEKKKIWSINSLENKEGRSFFKEVYIRRGNYGNVYGVEEPPECYMAYTTERVEKDGLKEYINKHKDIKTAIGKFCEDWKASGCSFASEFILKKE